MRTKALALFTALGVGPVVIALLTLLPSYAASVRRSEEQLQLGLIRELGADLERRATATRIDASAVAASLAGAAAAPAADRAAAFDAVRALLASRPTFDLVRFDVPGAGVSTILSREGAARDALPAAPAELLRKADEFGVAFAVSADGPGIVVVPIPASFQEGAAGYVTAPLYLDPIREDLRALVEARSLDDGQTTVLIVDAGNRVVASYPGGVLQPGQDVSARPGLRLAPSLSRPSLDVGITGDFQDGPREMSGALQSAPTLGWTLVLERPRAAVLAEYDKTRRTALYIGGGTLILAVAAAVFGARAVTRPVLKLAAQTQILGQRRWAERLPPDPRGDELGELSRSIDRMAHSLEESERVLAREATLRADLGRFLSRELVEAIVQGDHPLALGGERREVSIVFADVVASTPFAEKARPESVVELLNELFTVLSEVVFRHGGVVDKFIGDCVMAVFGAPDPSADHATRALLAAEDMLRFVETVVDDWRERFGFEVRLGIGVSSGEVIVGNVGSEKRMEYTVIGDAVNVGARLEGLAAPHQVLVSARTASLAAERFQFRSLGSREIPGRRAPIDVFEMIVE